MPLLRNGEERRYVECLHALELRFGEDARFDALDLCCWDHGFDRFNLVQDV